MPILEAENRFRKGLMHLVDGDNERASYFFRTAMEIEKERGVQRPQMRYLSYYGLSMARARRATREAVRACESAARADQWDPDLQLNLGRVYALAGKTSRALCALERGLMISPHHSALQVELAMLDRRATPPLPFLKRSHPLNCLLGKLRAKLTRGPRGRKRSGKEDSLGPAYP
jgi:tetratricopeptide (TPR) repeat protein